MRNNAQMSIEYMILTGFLLLILIVPGVLLLYSYGNSSVYETINQQKIADFGNGMADSVRQLYYLGLYSKKNVVYDLPSGVEYLFLLKTETIGPNPVTAYYIGVFLGDATTTKQFFAIDAPIILETGSIDSAGVAATIEGLISECASAGVDCTIQPLKKSLFKEGKRNFKLETTYVAAQTIGVQITPLLS
ncbi:MAG TPA: hypothetical protein VK158_01220 [Acidobacteriota bacterium]|nr:hypothetical protein [Acidobacteriota bacterium]